MKTGRSKTWAVSTVAVLEEVEVAFLLPLLVVVSEKYKKVNKEQKIALLELDNDDM